MIKLSSLSLLIPAYNDEATIEKVVAEAVAVGRRVAKKFEIIVTDDGSHDRTGPGLVNLMKKYKNIRVITHRTNQGYGRTIKELYFAGQYEWLFTIPGDYQIGAKEVQKLIPHIGNNDMILGWRVKRHDPTNRLFSSWIYNTLLRWLFGVTLHDVNSVRLLRRSVLTSLHLSSSSAFVDAELVIRTKRLGFSVTEIPIAHRARSDNEVGGGNSWRTVVQTIVDMIRFFL
ncbi:MAG: glycosyltransferase family 2 protein [Candidatus Gottesmanbacteria bacterium]|nr:glycosyltransferase family 2 protein [Candidatus Gottesmanbacteria bacterium]